MILRPYRNPEAQRNPRSTAETLAAIEEKTQKLIKKSKEFLPESPIVPRELSKTDIKAAQRELKGHFARTISAPKKTRVEHKAFVETSGRKPKYTTALLKSLRSKESDEKRKPGRPRRPHIA